MTISITTTDDAQTLVNSILGSGITISNLTYTGAAISSGTFTDGISSGIGIEEGLVLTTGDASLAPGTNDLTDTTGFVGAGSGDPDLSSLIPGSPIIEASILEFDFESETDNLFFNFVFASEEYNEFVNREFNDVFGFFLDGENIALIPGTQTPVAINNVNNGDPDNEEIIATNPQFFNNNDRDSNGNLPDDLEYAGFTEFDIEYDGFTDVFAVEIIGLAPGTHTIKLAIGDVTDGSLDSAVFIEGFSSTALDAMDDDFSTDEDTALSDENVLSNDIGPDTIAVTEVNGDPAAVGTEITLDSGALLTLNRDGTFDYDPNGAFEALNDGESASDSFTYSIDVGESATDTATVTININGITDNTVNPVNNAPNFTPGPDQTVLEDAGLQTVTGWATNIISGSADEISQNLTFIVSNDNAALFAQEPVIAPDGTLTYTTAQNAFGSATVTVTLMDDGGTENGGIDTSTIETFTINVTEVPDPLIDNPVTQEFTSFVGTEDNDGLTGTNDADSLAGLGGNDVLDGRDGADNLDGGSGTDTVVYQSDPSGVTVNLVEATASDGFGNLDNLISIENVISSEFADTLSGDNQNNSLAGRNGNDIINAGDGDDYLVGSAGADTLTGGSGVDNFIYIDPANGNDTITDFEVDEDVILIVGATFPGGLSGGILPESQFFFGSVAEEASHRFGYEASTGRIFFDQDGNGEASPQLLATLTGNPEFDNTDIKVI